MGLQIMRHRARLIDAELSFRARQGGGTVVTCILPATAGVASDAD
jgi:nitrate/nitrite-specific signal transduction histidine kinase